MEPPPTSPPRGQRPLWMGFASFPLHVRDSQSDGELSLCFTSLTFPGISFVWMTPCLHFEVDPDSFLLFLLLIIFMWIYRGVVYISPRSLSLLSCEYNSEDFEVRKMGSALGNGDLMVILSVLLQYFSSGCL